LKNGSPFDLSPKSIAIDTVILNPQEMYFERIVEDVLSEFKSVLKRKVTLKYAAYGQK
jgi:hypothetical protein